MKKIGCLLLLFSLGMLLVGCNSVFKNGQNNLKQTSETQETTVRNLVTEFGGQLQKVSLTDPKEKVAGSMQKYYGDYVSPSLLEKWKDDPAAAPGRMTSSPWPDGIQVISQRQLASDAFDVQGEIVEVTSENQAGSQPAGKQAIQLSVQKIGGRWMIVDASLDRQTSEESVLYENTQYGLIVTLPSGWKGYTVRTEDWQGYSLEEGQEGKITETGPEIFIRHPKWTQETPRQDIPILVFTLKQWEAIQNEKFHIGAAPMGPTELDRNSAYVFALPARYNFAFLPGYEEVDDLVRGGAIKATKNSETQSS